MNQKDYKLFENKKEKKKKKTLLLALEHIHVLDHVDEKALLVLRWSIFS